MPEWALGSFLLEEGPATRLPEEALGFNARVGAGFFSTEQAVALIESGEYSMSFNARVGAGFFSTSWWVRRSPPRLVRGFNARVGAGFFSTGRGISAAEVMPARFNARVGAGFFSTLREWGPTPAGPPIGFNARVGAGFFSTNGKQQRSWLLAVVSMPEWALGSFLQRKKWNRIRILFRVSMPEWALGSFLHDYDGCHACTFRVQFQCPSGRWVLFYRATMRGRNNNAIVSMPEWALGSFLRYEVIEGILVLRFQCPSGRWVLFYRNRIKEARWSKVVSMPEWALGSFLLICRYVEQADMLSFNARVGAGFFSTAIADPWRCI